MDRYATDEIYKKKVDYIEEELRGINGLILDIGGNTAGEATILTQKGYHFVDYDKILNEIIRVLKPGVKFISLEPYALNPNRKLSEVRDYFRGTIEKSFTINKVKILLTQNKFRVGKVNTVSKDKSSWKIKQIPTYRKPIAYLHSFLSNKLPMIFGSLLIVAYKDGKKEKANKNVDDLTLICPITKTKLHYDTNRNLMINEHGNYGYKLLNGIPIIIRIEGIEIK